MRYQLSEDQLQIRDVIGAFLADRYDLHSREAILRSPGHWSPDIWRAFAEELGVLGLTIPEDAGGLGGDALDALLVMDALGEALVVEPYLESCVIAPALLKHANADIAKPLLAEIAAGSARFALALDEAGARFAPLRATVTATHQGEGYAIAGNKVMVVGAPAATHLFVTAKVADSAGLGIFLVPADHPSIHSTPGRTLDGKGVAQLTFYDCAVVGAALLIAPEAGESALREALDAACAAICAEAAGIMRRMTRDTLGYLEQRRQFGTALIDFQVMQHRLAEMQVNCLQAEAMAFFAAHMMNEPAERRTAGIAATKVAVGAMLRSVVQEAVQMHGAMGVTEELAIGHLFKRATALENEFGSIDYHLDKVLEGGLPEESLAWRGTAET